MPRVTSFFGQWTKCNPECERKNLLTFKIILPTFSENVSQTPSSRSNFFLILFSPFIHIHRPTVTRAASGHQCGLLSPLQLCVLLTFPAPAAVWWGHATFWANTLSIETAATPSMLSLSFSLLAAATSGAGGWGWGGEACFPHGDQDGKRHKVKDGCGTHTRLWREWKVNSVFSQGAVRASVSH